MFFISLGKKNPWMKRFSPKRPDEKGPIETQMDLFNAGPGLKLHRELSELEENFNAISKPGAGTTESKRTAARLLWAKNAVYFEAFISFARRHKLSESVIQLLEAHLRQIREGLKGL